MFFGEPLIPKTSADLVDPFEATDDELFERKFERNPHEHIDRKAVVMRRKWARYSATGDTLKYRRFYLKKIAIIEK
jgi:hypothetical protein